MPYVLKDAEKLAGEPLVDGGDCVKLIKRYAPGLQGMSTQSWREGRKVRQARHSIVPGTAIATFVNGRYPQDIHTGKHAAFFLRADKDSGGFWVVDQWKTKPRVTARLLRPKGTWRDGSYIDPSNNADAFSVIER